ncbi:hypothetical protein IAI18_02545 [Acetobacteraceae bacterium H6797]|nr:hypothetical protein [Acetobacteraceae bacterium H6797]
MGLAEFEYRYLAGCPRWRQLTGRHVPRKAFTAPTPERMAALGGVYPGGTCFIIGTAPSLREFDLSRLNGRHCFSVNRGHDLRERGLERLTGYVIADQLAFDDYGALIDISRIDHLFIRSTVSRIPDAMLEKAVIYEAIRSPRLFRGYLQERAERGLYTGHTVVLDAIQLAAFMGFTRLAVIGVDLDFQPKDLHFYSSSQREVNHSLAHSQRYAGKMAKGMAVAHRLLAQRGVELVNAGRSDRLTMLPYVPFESLAS